MGGSILTLYWNGPQDINQQFSTKPKRNTAIWLVQNAVRWTRWLIAKLQYLQCISIGDTAVLH